MRIEELAKNNMFLYEGKRFVKATLDEDDRLEMDNQIYIQRSYMMIDADWLDRLLEEGLNQFNLQHAINDKKAFPVQAFGKAEDDTELRHWETLGTRKQYDLFNEKGLPLN